MVCRAQHGKWLLGSSAAIETASEIVNGSMAFATVVVSNE